MVKDSVRRMYRKGESVRRKICKCGCVSAYMFLENSEKSMMHVASCSNSNSRNNEYASNTKCKKFGNKGSLDCWTAGDWTAPLNIPARPWTV